MLWRWTNLHVQKDTWWHNIYRISFENL